MLRLASSESSTPPHRARGCGRSIKSMASKRPHAIAGAAITGPNVVEPFLSLHGFQTSKLLVNSSSSTKGPSEIPVCSVGRACVGDSSVLAPRPFFSRAEKSPPVPGSAYLALSSCHLTILSVQGLFPK